MRSYLIIRERGDSRSESCLLASCDIHTAISSNDIGKEVQEDYKKSLSHSCIQGRHLLSHFTFSLRLSPILTT